jgi:hypothetical protein
VERIAGFGSAPEPVEGLLEEDFSRLERSYGTVFALFWKEYPEERIQLTASRLLGCGRNGELAVLEALYRSLRDLVWGLHAVFSPEHPGKPSARWQIERLPRAEREGAYRRQLLLMSSLGLLLYARAHEVTLSLLTLDNPSLRTIGVDRQALTAKVLSLKTGSKRDWPRRSRILKEIEGVMELLEHAPRADALACLPEAAVLSDEMPSKPGKVVAPERKADESQQPVSPSTDSSRETDSLPEDEVSEPESHLPKPSRCPPYDGTTFTRQVHEDLWTCAAALSVDDRYFSNLELREKVRRHFGHDLTMDRASDWLTTMHTRWKKGVKPLLREGKNNRSIRYTVNPKFAKPDPQERS